MLQKSKSKKIFQLKYLLLVPVVCGMLIYSSCAQESNAQTDGSVASTESEVMDKINELAGAIMKKGELTDEEMRALKFLSQEAEPGDKIYSSVQEYLDDPNQLEIPFGVIEKVPTYPGCSGTNKELKNCMSKSITNFVMTEFNTKVASKNVTGKQRISVMFKIDNQGNVVNVKAKTEHPELKEEAIRVVSKLPKMLAGEHEGKKVGVLYSLPIIFDLK